MASQKGASALRWNASALLVGCHRPWRHQHPESDLLTRPDWHRLLPLVAQVQRHWPDMPLAALLTDRVHSARHLPHMLAWRLWQLLRQPRPQDIRPETSPHLLASSARSTAVKESENWHQHREAVRALGGPAAVRAALTATGALMYY